MASSYSEDLAYIHDVGFTDFIRRAAPGLLAILRKNHITDGLVVDLGCGTGVWAQALLRAGYDVLGVDISVAMLKIARRRAPRARFVKGSLFQYKLPCCRAVTAIGECVNYLFDPGTSQRRLRQFFRRVHKVLEPGGVFIFDIAEPGRVGQTGPAQKHVEGKDWAILVRNEEDRKTHILTRRMTIFRKRGTTYRRTQETHRQQLYTREEIPRLLEETGFRCQIVDGYGRLKLGHGQCAVLAYKDSRTTVSTSTAAGWTSWRRDTPAPRRCS